MRTRRQLAEQRAREVYRERVERELRGVATAPAEEVPEVEADLVEESPPLLQMEEVEKALGALRELPPPLPRYTPVTDEMVLEEHEAPLPGGYGTMRFFLPRAAGES